MRAFGGLLLLAGLLLQPALARAENYPSRPISLVVALAAGTGSSGNANSPQSNLQSVPTTTAP